ncbi:MAG TPA: tol-pal system protein YbgF [Thermoanaerobaculia bacterium]|jgi:tol-pal system protein YbgF
MKKLCVAVALLAAACSSTRIEPDLPPTVTQNAAPDPRVGEMQTQLTELLERIDVLNHRIARLEEGQPATPPVVVASRPAPVQPQQQQQAPRRVQPAPVQTQQPAQPQQRALAGADIAEDYRQAIILFGRGRHAESRRGFEAVYEADQSGDLADNALFWIGETYFAAKDYTNAARYYMRVVNDYSTQNKAPDALFKAAMVQERTGDLALARRTLQQVIERYPYSSTASTAKSELERLKF